MEVQASVKYSASCDLDRSEHNSRFNTLIPLPGAGKMLCWKGLPEDRSILRRG